MEFVLTKGCICGSLTADGEEEFRMTDERRKEVLKYLFDHLTPNDLNYVLQALIKEFGDYECNDEPCEECGDYVETYTWKL